MTLDKVKALLEENSIPFSELHFNSVGEFRLHISPFAYLKNAETCQVTVLVISSNNNHKNIELQFIDENNDGNYIFVDLYFGEYSCELFDCYDEFLQHSIIDNINDFISNNLIVIVANDLTKGRWYSTAVFDRRENDGFGSTGFENAMKRINRIKKKKRFIAKFFESKMQYEIYDWNTYECIIK